MSVLYVTDQGSYLKKKGNQLVITKEGKILQRVHAFKLEQVVLMGNISLSPGAIAFLLREGIDTVFMSIYGKYRGRLISSLGKNIELRQLQFQKMSDEKIRLALAELFVLGKLNNCRVLLRRYNRGLNSTEITTALHRIRTTARHISRADSISALMGFEGHGAALHFGVYGKLIKVDDITFNGRNRRPPKDPVNVLLSLGYTLLANLIHTQVNITGLDPYMGCFHSVEYGRPSLVLDLMEEFRPVLVDSLVLQVINKRIIRSTDFYRPEEREPAAFDFAETEPHNPELPIILTHTGLKKFITQFEARINQRVLYEPKGQQLSYRDICLEQVRSLLVRHLKEEDKYSAFIMR